MYHSSNEQKTNGTVPSTIQPLLTQKLQRQHMHTVYMKGLNDSENNNMI